MPEKMFLVDGSNQAFRAFFAIQSDMRAPDGFPTRALYGFTNMLQRLIREHEPDYLAVVFDQGRVFGTTHIPTTRVSVRICQKTCDGSGLSSFQCAASGEFVHWQWRDSRLMTSSELWPFGMASNDCQVWIVSSDKDFCQLVTDDIHLLDVGKGKDIGPAEVQERWGVAPTQIIELLALMGDSSDNIPGVPGVGPKRPPLLSNVLGEWSRCWTMQKSLAERRATDCGEPRCRGVGAQARYNRDRYGFGAE